MPELPEVEVVRRSLAVALEGRRVEAVKVRPVRLREGLEPGEWPPLIGRRLEGIERRGKYLLLRLAGLVVLLHLGMSGRLLLRRRGTQAAPHTHLEVAFERDVALHLVDPRRFGTAVVIPEARLDHLPALAALGPDALSDEAAGAVAAAAAGSRAPIRSLLLDQTVVAGIGNIYATEALARAGIHPGRHANRIGRARLARLAAAIRAVLEDAVAAGGTTLADGGFQDADGNPGYFSVDLQVYGRTGAPCQRCNSTIRRVVIGGRSAYYCPRCQR